MRRIDWEKIKLRIDNIRTSTPAPTTIRTRRLRARKKQGWRCATILVHDAMIGELICQGLLPYQLRADQAAIERLLTNVLYDKLMPKTPWLRELRSQSITQEPNGIPNPEPPTLPLTQPNRTSNAAPQEGLRGTIRRTAALTKAGSLRASSRWAPRRPSASSPRR